MSEKEFNQFIIEVLKDLYAYLVKRGLEVPFEITTENLNPKKYIKYYKDDYQLIIHYMLNEGLIDGKIVLHQPLVVNCSITLKGYQYIMAEKILNI